MSNNEDLKFLKELQEELKNQDNDCQASPRYWTIGDFEMIECQDGNQDSYMVYSPNNVEADDLIELLIKIKDELKNDGDEEFSQDAKEEFNELFGENDDDIKHGYWDGSDAIYWINRHYDTSATLIPVKEVHVIKESTMFLTKAEAKRHLELNHYHYSVKAHTYAMTAWRAPQVERLFKILETFDWDSVYIEGEEK